MEPCNRVNEWLEQDPPPDMTKIPAPLVEHVKNCRVCRNTLEYFQNLAQARNHARLSSSETAEFMKKFQAKAEISQPSPAHPVRHIPLHLAFVGAALVCALVVWSVFFRQAPPLSREKVQPFAVLIGKAMIVSDDGKQTPTPVPGQDILRVTMIAFDSSAEPVSVTYRNGGTVTLSGTGKLKLLKGGLDVESGTFNARFKKLAGIYTVRVPGAVLGIRGTEIRFDIQPARSGIALLEGAVDLIPDDAAQKTIRMEKGTTALLEGNTWVVSSPLPPQAPSGGTRNDSFAEPVASRPITPPVFATGTPERPAPETENVASIPEEGVATGPEDVPPGAMIETGEDTAPFGSDGFGEQSPTGNP